MDARVAFRAFRHTRCLLIPLNPQTHPCVLSPTTSLLLLDYGPSWRFLSTQLRAWGRDIVVARAVERVLDDELDDRAI